MARKGSITVFLTLILSLMLSLVCTSIESVRMAAARTQILSSLDIGLYSLFGQYDKTLLQEYDLFFLDGSCGGGALDMAEIYDNMESYIKPVLKQNSQKISLAEGGFTGYRLATDEGGEVFYCQVIQYMKDTLGSQGIQLLVEKMKDRENKTKEAENTGEQAQSGDAIGSYEREMDQAAKNSQDAIEEAKENSGQGQEIVIQPEEPAVEAVKVKNPITVIKRIMKMGILELVIPPGKGVSENSVAKNTLVSGRKLQEGMPLFGNLKQDDSYAAQVLFQQYLMDKLGNYQNPASGGLKYQIEYILSGKDNDLDNLKSVASKLLLVREGVNFAHLLADTGKRAQVEALALAIASAFLIPPAAVVIEGALLLCWAFAESILDVRELFDGGKVPLIKSVEDWQISLEKLPELLQGLDTERRGTETGMDYEDYLQVFLLTKGKQAKLSGGMDMVELSVRNLPGRSGFCLDSCIASIEASIDVKANSRKVFTATKQYSYI